MKSFGSNLASPLLAAIIMVVVPALAQPADAPLCVNNVCIGHAVHELPAGSFERAPDLKATKQVLTYAIQYGKFLEGLEKRSRGEQAYFLGVVTGRFDGEFIRYYRSQADLMSTGTCAYNVTLTGALRDGQGRQVEVTISGGKPDGRAATFYVTRIKKVFGRDLDMKRLETEVKKTWPSALVKEFNEGEANSRPVVIDTVLGHLVLQATPEQRKAWSQAAQASDICAPGRKRQDDKYQIN